MTTSSMLFDGGSDFARRGVELGLTGVEVATGASLERNELDALDTQGVRKVVGWGLEQIPGQSNRMITIV
jgi:hypothetical protein